MNAHPAVPNPCGPSRRELLRNSALAAVGIGLAGGARGAAAPTPSSPAKAPPAPAVAATPPPMPPLNRFPRMVQEYFVRRVREVDAERRQTLDALRNKAQAQAYVESVRGNIRLSFGPFPEKTPLNPRVTGVVDRDTYTIEKVIFESRPGFLVTANFYLPKNRKAPVPGVVGACGHSNNGKAAEAYQSFAQGLARMGYAVLIYDPLGQGERLQYPDAALKSKIGVGVREHLHAGNQQFLVGEFIGAWRAWDGIRALDYLLTRPEVDPRHVGVTGNSGGGTLTTWLCGVDRRWTMGAPSCFVTMFRRNLENELPADTEQCPPRALALGLDHEDFIAAMAPKPVILLAKEEDFFDVRGTEEAYERLKRLYRLLGAEDHISLSVTPGTHGYTQESREAMYRWFNRWTGVSKAEKEPQLVIEKDETLWCAPKGQVCELGSRPIWTFTRDRAQALAAERSKPDAKALSKAIRETLRLPAADGVPDYRILRPLSGRKYPRPQAAIYAVETEPGIQALVRRLGAERREARPPQGPSRAVLYVAHQSADAELRDEPLVKELLAAEPDAAFYACDVRGIGESRPDTCGANSFLDPYGSDFFYAIHSIMLDEPYPGRKTFDVLRVIDWLGRFGHTQIHLAALGWGTVPATFAAVLSVAVFSVTLKQPLASYGEIAAAEQYDWPLSALVPGVLMRFDISDCHRVLRGKCAEFRVL